MLGSKEKIVENLSNLIFESYGSRLTEKEKEEIRKSIEQTFENSVKLHQISLENGDEPFSVFIPYRKEKN
ncbi:hypothetical protein FJY84_02165 [Candidatus Bathyarchaeota archaeon]|nr:hypothetical protein [Candidatus Bathyarchaeota archaeon]